MEADFMAIKWFRSSGPVIPLPENRLRKVALWDVTRKCDLRCVHCYNFDKYMAHSPSVEIETSTEEAISIIDKLASFGFNQIHFLGGEPLNRSDCITLFSHAASKGIAVTINTNGIRLTADMVNRLIDSGINQIGVSLDGSDESSNDRIRGNGTFRRIMANLEQASKIITRRESDLMLGIISTLTRPLLQEPEKVGGYFPLANQLGINWLNFIFLYKNSKALTDADKLAYPMGLALDVLETQVVKGKRDFPNIFVQLDCRPLFGKYLNRKYGIITHIYHWAIKCSAGNRTWLIDADGQTHPCGICTSPEYGIAAADAGCFTYEPMNIVSVNDCQEIYESEYFHSVRSYLFDIENYRKFHICKECEYFGDVCLPCPLYSTEGPAYELESCGVEECEWIIRKLEDFYDEQKDIIPILRYKNIDSRMDESGKLSLSIPNKEIKFKLFGTGRRIWELIDGKTPVSTLVDSLAGSFAECPDRRGLQRDVVDFLCSLRDGNILTLEKEYKNGYN